MSGFDNTSETVRTTAVTTTLTNNDYDLLCLGITGNITVNLPAVASVQPGRFWRCILEKLATTSSCTWDRASSNYTMWTVSPPRGASYLPTACTDGGSRPMTSGLSPRISRAGYRSGIREPA